VCGSGSSVGIATDYGLDGPGLNPGGDEIFRTHPDQAWGPPSGLDGLESNPGGDEIFRTRPDRPWGPPSLV
jgi:hypothetical protein